MRNAPKRAAAVAALTKLTSRPATVKQEHMDTEEGPPTAKRNRRDSLLNADQPLMLDYGKAIFADASHYILLYPSKRHPGERILATRRKSTHSIFCRSHSPFPSYRVGNERPLLLFVHKMHRYLP